MEPVGPLTTPPTNRSNWVSVRTRGRVTTATFLPSARVVWRIRWGSNGPDEKVTEVDDRVWLRSAFTYDAAGHLATKMVTGPGAPTPLTYAYRTDASGRIVARTGNVPRVVGAPIFESVTLVRSPTGIVVETQQNGVEVRRDVRDPSGRLLETRFYAQRREVARLTYRRRAGALSAVERTLGTRRGAADATQPDPHVTSADLRSLEALTLSREEAWLLLGAPIHSTDEGRGTARRVTDDWSSGCWMNESSGIRFDAAGLAHSTTSDCICGFCVDASLAVDVVASESVLATDLHYTRGPWIRLDGHIDVTADHAVMTPSGPVLAGELRAGALVLASDRSTHTLVSVERLPQGALRLGRNLRTVDGVFAAGGLLFASEMPRACSP